MSEHTPGPWQTVPTHYQEGFTVLAQPTAALRGFTKVIAFVGNKADEETAANARLIAAAPDLLAALEATAAAIGDWSLPTGANGMTTPSSDHPLLQALAVVRAAISKAGGASS